jgi:hypothetical protein
MEFDLRMNAWGYEPQAATGNLLEAGYVASSHEIGIFS